MTPASASVAKPAWPPVPKPTTRRPIPAATDCTRRLRTSTISPATSSSCTSRRTALASSFREAPVHALSRSRLRCRLSLPGSAQGSGVASWLDGRQCIGCRYCTITCPYHIPRFQWVGIQPTRYQVRVVQPPAGERAEAGMHQRVSGRRRDFRSAHGLAARRPSGALRTIPAATIRTACTGKPTTAAHNVCTCRAFPS
jgi:Fe-S-cluster-containing hydrogenase component 2